MRCGAQGDSFRYFNRRSMLSCFDRLATSWVNGTPSFRLLNIGNSVMRAVHYALNADDVFPDEQFYYPNRCGGYGQEGGFIRAFEPHAVHLLPWNVISERQYVVSSAMTKAKHRDPKCWSPSAIDWMVSNAPAPYNAVAIYAGAWDASFTTRNATSFENAIDYAVRSFRGAWNATVILFTMTPCGGVTPGGQISWMTLRAACEFVEAENEAIRRVAARQGGEAGHVLLLDAHQMTTSRPGHDKAGEGSIWPTNTSKDWHFAGVLSAAEREAVRASGSAAGEMNRAFALRLLNAICPAEE